MKTIDEIYQELLETFAEKAGFVPEESCDLSVRLYAVAAQVQSLLIQADWVLDQSFPQTAQGKYLDYHAQLRGITRQEAARAQGTLRFLTDNALATDLMIEAGTECMTEDNVRFVTTKEATMAAGTLSVDVPAAAVVAGSAGNAVAGSIVWMAAMPVGITRCTNPNPFAGGSDAEDDESLRKRILESYQRLPNGANAAFYQKIAMNHASVAAATVVGRARGIGTVDVYVAAATGIPSEELLEEIRADLQEKREIAVDVQVLAPRTREVAVTAQVKVQSGYAFESVKTSVEEALVQHFSGKQLGKAVTLAQLGNLIYHAEGVENYHIALPTEDIPEDSKVLPVLGAVTISEMKG
ncbi:baseplate J/gp47 family protein [Oscillibacter hominis]|uniref:Baseplate J/gp47 family protein n=1 Tax=Oscillibacter hominis TaxID=2763056 RepID=A0A7G9B2C5_9FIRM|nr:baseplate J/gp47 family protein [Oscillibacter hominis]QNL43706.1 baseplate J/gp47 family protein [Oscillibacter hominis]